MKAIMVMYDSLNRRRLSPYGCDWVKTPNFDRLAKNSVKFTNCYVGSMPCMPARRELHTGRLNFLHRSWGPMEPFDDSMPQMLKNSGIYTHLTTDHSHYWEEGGATYHTKFNTYEFQRGQEGDCWKGEVKAPDYPEQPATVIRNPQAPAWRQDHVNRKYIKCQEDMPQHKTFETGLEFIRTNIREDNWFLQIETFDPHEPYFTLQEFKDLYPHEYKGAPFDWPPYTPVSETEDEIRHIQYENAALVSMCDFYLGQVLAIMDEYDMWKDTMLIVNTDHGFLLGEHDWWAKCTPPFYNEVAHVPLFVWDPKIGKKGTECDQLVQSIDLAPTLLDFFDVAIPKDMLGKSLRNVVEDNESIHEAVLYGIFGGHINCTDGRYVYMLAPKEGNPYKGEDLYNYTIMPTHLRTPFTVKELQEATLAEPFSFTKGISVLKVPGNIQLSSLLPKEVREGLRYDTMLFDLESDPKQEHPIHDDKIEQMMKAHILKLMKENDAPEEQYKRMGLVYETMEA